MAKQGFSKIVLLVVVIVVLLLGLGAFYVVMSYKQPTAAPIAPSAPQVKTTDLAPQTPDKQKTAILVMHADSSYEKFLVPSGIVANFLKSLPADDKIISETPLPGK